MGARKLIIILNLFCIINLNAQNFKLNNVIIAELQQIFYPNDSTAAAAHLFKNGTVHFESDVYGRNIIVYTFEKKTKIYKKEGLEYASIEIPYSSYYEKIEIKEANSYNIENNSIVKTTATQENIFDQDYQGVNIKRIAVPNVKAGSIIELKYTIRTYSSVYPKKWDFQEDIPITYSSYEFISPGHLIYSHNITPNNIRIRTEQAVKKSIRSIEEYGYVNRKESRTLFVANNVPAIRKEPLMGNIDNYIASVSHELTKRNIKNDILDLSTTWEDVARVLNDDKDFGKQIQNKKLMPSELKEKLQNNNYSETQKIDIIFSYVKNNIKWNDYVRGVFCTHEKDLNKTLKEKSGNIGDINLLLVTLLKNAGINADPVVLSTRNIGYYNEPNLRNLNYVLAGVQQGSDIMLLDATSESYTTRVRPTYTINNTGRLIRSNNSTIEVDLIPNFKSKKILHSEIEIDPKGNTHGKSRYIYQDYYSLLFENQNTNDKNFEKRIQQIEKERNLTIDKYTRNNPDDHFKTITENFEFTGYEKAEVIQENVYFSINNFAEKLHNPFTNPTREYPIDLLFPYQYRNVLLIDLPQGYELQHVPKSIQIYVDDKIGSYTFSNTIKDNKLTVIEELNFNVAFFSKDYYNSIQNFYNRIIEKQNEKFILTKQL